MAYWLKCLGLMLRNDFIKATTMEIYAMICDFNQCGILTSVDSDEPL